jgi:hypothetical protein
MNPIFRCSIGNRSFRRPDLIFRDQRAQRRSRRAGGPRAIARLVLDRREHAGTLGQIKEKPDPALDRQHGIYPDQRLLKGLHYEPRVIVTDKLRSYGIAQRQLLPGVVRRQSRYLNNRAENSHRPTRRRERQMQRFKSSRHAQDFLSAHSFIYGHFRPRRHLLPAPAYREIRSHAFDVWGQETCIRKAA